MKAVVCLLTVLKTQNTDRKRRKGKREQGKSPRVKLVKGGTKIPSKKRKAKKCSKALRWTRTNGGQGHGGKQTEYLWGTAGGYAALLRHAKNKNIPNPPKPRVKLRWHKTNVHPVKDRKIPEGGIK